MISLLLGVLLSQRLDLDGDALVLLDQGFDMLAHTLGQLLKGSGCPDGILFRCLPTVRSTKQCRKLPVGVAQSFVEAGSHLLHCLIPRRESSVGLDQAISFLLQGAQVRRSLITILSSLIECLVDDSKLLLLIFEAFLDLQLLHELSKILRECMKLVVVGFEVLSLGALDKASGKFQDGPHLCQGSQCCRYDISGLVSELTKHPGLQSLHAVIYILSGL